MTDGRSVDEQLGDLLQEFVNRVSHLLGNTLSVLTDESVTLQQILLLRRLQQVGHSTPSELAELMHMSQPAVSQMIDRLLLLDLVTHTEAPDDRRRKIRYLGSEYIADTFRIARGVDSTAKLYMNEQLESFSDARAEAFFKLAQHLKQEGVPIDGVGLQSHFGFVLPSRQEFRAFLARLTALGLEVEITELDARLALFRGTADPYRAQADYYGQLLGTCLENPGCKGLTFWGFADDHCWMDSFPLFPKPNEPYLFDAHRIPKPAVGALDSVFSEHVRDGQTGRSRQDEGALP